MMEIVHSPLSGCFSVHPKLISDLRGSFLKTYQKEFFDSATGLNLLWKEEFITSSKRNVLRGMHFQIPPLDHEKLVCCLQGEVIDVVVDLRKNSPTYGKTFSINLSGEKKTALFVPKGLAHGFFVISDTEAVMSYKTTTNHSPEHDSGILWESIDFAWPHKNPILSERDKKHVPLNQFNSPFTFTARK